MRFPTFGKWMAWGQRTTLPGSDQPGVYLLARFEQGPPATASPLDPHIVCIAETHDQSLGRRWNQFHYCAFQQGTGHSEGRTFSRVFCNGEPAEVPAWLFVAAAPISWDEPQIKDQVQTSKRELLTEFRTAHGELPRCNAKIP